MPVWELVGYDTGDHGSATRERYRAYTTSQKTAELFCRIPKIQFTDSGHGIVFHAFTHTGKRKPERRGNEDHVRREMANLRRHEARNAARDRSVAASRRAAKIAAWDAVVAAADDHDSQVNVAHVIRRQRRIIEEIQ